MARSARYARGTNPQWLHGRNLAIAAGGKVVVSTILNEIDRQLGEQRAHADALASRSGLMIGAIGLLSGFVGFTNQQSSIVVPPSFLWIASSSAILGVLVHLSGRILSGPSPSALGYMRSGNPDFVAPLEDAKMIALEANYKALTRTETIFALQAASAIAAIAIVVVAG